MQIKITIITIITSLLGITGCQTTTNSSAIFGPQGREIVSVSYPSGAPKIISDFRTMTGVRGGEDATKFIRGLIYWGKTVKKFWQLLMVEF